MLQISKISIGTKTFYGLWFDSNRYLLHSQNVPFSAYNFTEPTLHLLLDFSPTL